MAKSASLKSVDFSLALALSKLDILLCIYLIYRQHVFMEISIMRFHQFYALEQDCRNYNIIYFIIIYLIQACVHKISKNACFKTLHL